MATNRGRPPQAPTGRRRSSVKHTLLCATRFWSIDDGTTPTLSSGVRSVVRRQGFSTAEINKAERELVKSGRIEVAGRGTGKTIKLTSAGSRVRCSMVSLAPWTNAGYPGAALAGRRRRR